MISNQNKSCTTASTTFTTSNEQNDNDDCKYGNTRKINRNNSNVMNRMDSSDSDNYADITEMGISNSPESSDSKSEFNDDFVYEDAMNKADLVSSLPEVDDDDDDCGMAQLYLNEMEINRSEEEQTITELVHASDSEGNMVVVANRNTSMRVAIGIILRLVLPLANGVVRGIQGIRDVRFLRVLQTIASSRQAFTNLIAFAANTISMNLSSVQVSHRIEPILKLMKIRKSRDGLESLPDTPGIDSSDPATPIMSPTISFAREPSNGALPNFSASKRKASIPEHPASKCCTLNILAEPPAGCPIRADIVFIHGLHGSLVNTWKQGVWENERRPVEFERPPKPPVRPPKRPRHSRSTLMHPPHKQKRARFANQPETYRQSNEKDTHDDINDGRSNNGDFSYVCGEPEDIQVSDGIEYSFPTFRVRMNDNGRQLQAELESILNDEKPHRSNEQQINDKKKQTNGKKNTKPSPDDPDYSKCWPGDWLPLDCPGVRVIALNYTTDQYLWRPLWKKKEARTNLIERSREMAELLIKHRVGYGHPIVWVGHSKGGLFVKQILVDAWESGRPAMAPFWRSSRGVFFYSVPHRGSHLASIKAPLLTRSVELLDIEKNSKYLLDLHRRFAGLYHLGHLKIEVFSFVETALTLMSVLYMRIVGVDSADPGIGDVCGIRLDHREICKPRSRDCILYKELIKMIKKVC